MDREQFDALARMFASPQSRRNLVGALLGTTLLAHGAPVLAKVSKSKGKGHHKHRGEGHEKSNGQGHENDTVCDSAGCVPPKTFEPGFCCKDGACSCGGKCCGDQCFFVIDLATSAPVDETCCTGPKLVYCPRNPENSQCCLNEGPNPCDSCILPSGIVGSYRRR